MVDKTGKPYFGGTNGSNLIIGANQDMIEEVIYLYRRKVVIHVDGNGAYSESMEIVGENE